MTQNQRVLKLLRERKSSGLNTVDLHAPACDGGRPILRLAARIRDLQDQGFRIRSERKLNGTASYILEEVDVERNVVPPPAEPQPSVDGVSLNGSLFDPGAFTPAADYRDVPA